MLHSGIDLHRRLIVICTVDDQGTVVARTRIKTEAELVSAYFRQWNDPHQAVVECTSNWYWLCDLLRSLGITVILAHAKYLKAISYAKVKTDAVDAHTLAQLLRMGYIPEAHQLPNQYRAMRDLLRQRMVMERKRTNLMQHATAILAKFNITDLPVTPAQPAFPEFLATCQLPDEYRMTILMYHQQCLQVAAHEKHLEQFFKAQLRPTPTLQLPSPSRASVISPEPSLPWKQGTSGASPTQNTTAPTAVWLPVPVTPEANTAFAPAPRMATSTSSTRSPKLPSRR